MNKIREYNILDFFHGRVQGAEKAIVGFRLVSDFIDPEIELLKKLFKENGLKFDDMRYYEDIIFTGKIEDLVQMGLDHYANKISQKEVRDYFIQNVVWLDPVH